MTETNNNQTSLAARTMVAIVTYTIGLVFLVSGKKAWREKSKRLTAIIVGCNVQDTPADSVKSNEPELADLDQWRQVQLEDGSVLSVALYGDLYRRWILQPREGIIEAKRIDLTYLSEYELTCLSYTNDVDMAIKYTLNQIRMGVLCGAEGKQGFVKTKSSETKQAKMSDETVSQKPVKPTKPVPSENKFQKPSIKAAGVVTFAGTRTMRSDSRAPYETFTVILVDKHNEEHVFTGVDLNEKFHQGVFAVGDRISIEKKTVSFFLPDGEGREKQRRKNEYIIAHI